MTFEEIKEIFRRPTDERALLSYCFRNIDFFYTLASNISSRDFLSSDNSVIFTLFGALSQKGVEAFDLPLLINEAERQGALGSIGGIDYLQSINEMSVSDQNFDVYLGNVLEASTKFRLYAELKDKTEAIEKNAKEGKTSADLIGMVENAILDLSTESKAIREPRNLADGLRELIDERKEQPVKQMGLPTGFPILDKQIDGLVPKTLTVVAARPKAGKSTFLSNIASYLAYQEGVPILYIDTEMDFDQWRDRIVASMTGIRERVIKHGGYDEETYRRIVSRCLNIVENGKLFHEYMPGYTVDKLVALYKKYKIKHNIGLMIFDYIKEPDSSSIDRQRKEYQILGDVTTKLKDLSGELEIPALTAIQLNRDHDIADSDRIARYADVICLWSLRDKKELEDNDVGRIGSHKLVVRETRRGGATPPEGIGYHFYKETLYVKEVDPEDQLINYTTDTVMNYGSAELK